MKTKQTKSDGEKLWCAMCGTWGDHQSGSCPELKHLREGDDETDDNGYEHVEKLNGVTAFVFWVKDGGRQITVSGWHPNHSKFKIGERVLLVRDSGEGTRYRIKEIRRPHNPSDQYFMDCEFAPRMRLVES